MNKLIENIDWRKAHYGEKATHAVCKCDRIAKINNHHHTCLWQPVMMTTATTRKEGDDRTI